MGGKQASKARRVTRRGPSSPVDVRLRRVGTSGRRDGGAALVEMALVLPLLLMLLVGIVSAGIAYNHQLSLAHSAREAGRYGATLPVSNFGTMSEWLDAVAVRAVDSAVGTLGPGTAGFFTCVAFVHPDGTTALDSTFRRVDNGSGSPTYEAGVCFADGRPNDERRVQVRVARDVNFNAVVFSRTVNLDSDAVNRVEAGFDL